MGSRWRAAIGLVAVGAMVTAVGGCGTPQWSTELVSVNAAGTDSGAGYSGGSAASLTADGNRVVFASTARDLVANDTNGVSDVFVRDLAAGTTTLVSVNAGGTGSGNSASDSPQLSADGTKVLFVSAATDLGPAATRPGVYVRDLVAGTTTLVTVDATGSDASEGWPNHVQFSPDGTKVAWTTTADDLGPLDPDRPPAGPDPEPDPDPFENDVYLRDLVAGTTTLVSVAASGTGSGDGPSDHPTFGPGATSVLFTSSASDLVAGDTDNAADMFVHDLASGTTTLVTPAPVEGTVPQYSADGATVAYTTSAGDLGPTDSDCSATPPPLPPMSRPCSDVYVQDVATGEVTLVSRNAAGTDSAEADSRLVALSQDGTRVVFVTSAGDLGPADAGYDVDLYLHDLTTGVTSLVTVGASGTDGLNSDRWGVYPVVSPDATKVAFGTMATNLGPTDTNDTWDVYVRDLTAGRTVLVSDTASGTAGNGQTLPVELSPDGRRLLLDSKASDLVPHDTNGRHDLFVARLPAPPVPPAP
jgi:Tol biopolymer transport system component